MKDEIAKAHLQEKNRVVFGLCKVLMTEIHHNDAFLDLGCEPEYYDAMKTAGVLDEMLELRVNVYTAAEKLTEYLKPLMEYK